MMKTKATATNIPPTLPSPITDPSALPVILTAKEVAVLLRRKIRSVYELVEKEAIPFSRPKHTRMIIFKRDEILEWSGLGAKKPQS